MALIAKPMANKYLEYLSRAALLVLLYVGAGKLGLSLAYFDSSASPVWPPTGLALAALLLWEIQYWPAIFLGAFLVNYFIVPEGELASALAIAGGNTLEAVLGAYLTRRLASGIRCFRQVPDTFRFIFIAALPSTLLSAVVGVTTLYWSEMLSTHGLIYVGLTWWTGDFVSALVVAPLLIIWIGTPMTPLKPLRMLELGLLLATIGVAGVVVFGPWNSFGGVPYPLAFLTVPPLLWAAYRFRDRGAVTGSAMLSTFAIAATIAHNGPFVLPHPNDSLMLLQLFLGVNAGCMLVLAALVNDRTRTADTIEEHQQRLLLALEAGKMGTWDWDMASGKVHWSANLEKLHGLPPGGFSGTVEAFLQDVHPEDRERIRSQIGKSVGGQEHHTQYRLLLKDGTIRWVEGRGQLILDRTGKPVSMLGICVDVTEHRLAQQERERLLERERAARSEAERANRSKDNFLAVLSHELRTPLTPVLLTTSLLESDPTLPPSFRGDVEMIRRNVEMEARLIDDLLDITRITRGKLQLQFQSADLHEIITRAIDISCRGASVNMKIHLDAPRHRVRADPGRIQQVLWNLLNNARKFTPAGGTITVRSSNPDEKTIRVEVIDSGSGISPDAIGKLFLAFEQGDSAEAKRAGGLGLGLAISKALVVAHGGSLSASSEGVGKGATFRVEFATIAPPTAKPANGNGGATPPTQRIRILLVEDNIVTLQALRRLLLAREHHVVEATSIASAKEAAAREPVDLVISDLGLPDGMGHEMMRDLGQRYGVRGIAISGYGMPEDIDQSRRAGFIEHLVKPVDAAALDAAISRALGTDGSPASPSAQQATRSPIG